MADYEKMSDRELDAAVAEKVMGPDRKSDQHPTFGWHPSTSIAAAWEVVDRVLDLAFSCFGGMTGVNLLYNPYESRWEASFDWSDSTCVNGWHEKPARAICLAALAAVEAKEKTNG